MRFTLSSTALNTKLQTLAKAINSRNSLAILGDFVFSIKNGRLNLSAGDGENVLNTSLSLIESDGDGGFCIGSRDLLDGLRGFSEQPITLDIDQQKNIAKISYLNGELSMPVENAEDYPQTPAIGDDATVISIESGILASNLNRSIFATAQDELRPVMNGLLFDLTKDCLAIIASDGHKLVRNRIFTIKSDSPTSFILPKKPAQLLKNSLSGEGDVTIRFNSSNAQINFDEGTLTCRLIEGRYPNYNSVIPHNNKNEITIDRAALLAALRRVQPFSSGSSNLVRFHVEAGILQLDAEDFDFAKTAHERLACDYNGQIMNIGFKGGAFIDVLANLDSTEVVIQLADASRAGIIVPAVQPENQDVLMLLMPMLLND